MTELDFGPQAGQADSVEPSLNDSGFLAPADDSVEQFAQDLRQSRHSHGFPKLTTMQFHTGISKSTISAALKGDRLPSEKTVRALADFFEEDSEVWSRRRSRLDRHTPTARTEPEIDFNPQTGLMETPEQPADATISAISDSGIHMTSEALTAPPTPIRRRALLLATVTTAVVTALATSLAWYFFAPTTSSAQASKVEHYVDFSTGVDPLLTVCRTDADVAAAADRIEGAVFIEIMHSPRCDAVWARATRYDAKTAGNSIHVKLFRSVQPTGPDVQESQTANTQSVYTPMLVLGNGGSTFCATATVTLSEEEDETATPVCI